MASCTISTGETEYDGKAFVLHSDSGTSRVACGLLGPAGAMVDGGGDPPDAECSQLQSVPTSHHALHPFQVSTLKFSGSVVVFADTSDGTTVGYGGHVMGLEPGLLASDCPATNGCGVHIHSGMGCEDSAAQGGHYFADPIMTDPWITAQYSSDAEGSTTFGASLEMGTVDLEGRAFVVHAEDGSRVGCGILSKVESHLGAGLASLGDSSAMGSVTALPVADTDLICYMGYAMNLEPDLSAFYAPHQGPNCTATNGCGTHVHAGTSCDSTETQMGHYGL
ncbi:unnamed protein product [Cylindrotheca closterium]|uniref:Superoxide dismutase copper/zinc binding domain-containing protein n=1 Tax=Cylindrotheca closterium TaxID=2856 RepID=A0AAD2JML9_9STRA|nr:unnamed protein product [Cylindrotheca closterium]